jgi:hypothetical protein
LRTLYDSEGVTPADREVIVQALGYSSRNGASDSVLAALGYYGLLDETSDRRLKVNRRGLDILLGESGDPERARAIQEAATLPELFAELSKQFGDGKYSNRNVGYQ